MSLTTSNLLGKNIAILGAGRSGRAAAAIALREGGLVTVYDSGGEERLADFPAGVRTCAGFCENHLGDFEADLAVISPGIDTYSPLIQAIARKTKLIGETQFGAYFFDGGIIGITGTNGKTTTTELVSLILKEAGHGGTPCGNYGAPLCEILLQPDIPKTIALELSSFQLETIDDFCPKVSIWLNFAADHMDRYPTIDAYKSAKLNIFKNQTAADTIVTRFGEDIGSHQPKIVTFSTESREADYFSDGITIMKGASILLDLEAGTSLRGLHNAENAMAAIAACIAYGIEPSLIPAALVDYAPPPHRCELIRTLDGVEYINDSKATNLHALQCALRSQTRPVVLIAGGKDKELDYSPLLPLLSKQAISIVTFGEIARPLAEIFSTSVPSTPVHSLTEAIDCARSLAPRGSTILLSPGTSSFDQFTGYEQRGDTFRHFVDQLS